MAITYEQRLINQISNPGTICGPDVIDDRSWWQHLPWLNPYAELEAQAWQASQQATQAAASTDGPCAGHTQPEAEAG